MPVTFETYVGYGSAKLGLVRKGFRQPRSGKHSGGKRGSR